VAYQALTPTWRPNKPIQPTPLRGPKIVGILNASFVPTAFLIYMAARLMGRALGGNPSRSSRNDAFQMVQYQQYTS
jgi:hypothetical protein